MATNNRRKLLKTAVAAMAATGAAQAQSGPPKKVHYMGEKPAKTPLFSSAVSYGNLLFIAGIGSHLPGDIKVNTNHVLEEIEKQLKNAGSSMEKVLKVSVFLSDIKDFQAMNEVYLGRFGENPPVRTTISPASLPGGSSIEIDVIAYI